MARHRDDDPPPPLAGGGWGEGAGDQPQPPPPNPLPQGEGEYSSPTPPVSIVDTLLAAIAHQRARRHDAAEALYRSVISVQPRNGQALYLYGLLLLQSNRPHEAAGLLRAAATARPGHSATLVSLGRALLADRRMAETLQVAEEILLLEPNHAEALFLRGTALGELGEPALAAAALQAALAGDPGNGAAWLNLGNACADLDQLEEAERNCREAIRLAPDLAEAYVSLAFALTSLGRPHEAMAACRAAIALRPDFALAHWNLAVAALLTGDFAFGFEQYEWRKCHDTFRRGFIDLPGPQWNGGDPAGRTILVHAEQGLGDTIQFARYLPLIGARTILACDRPLLPLLAQVSDVVPKDAPLPRFDCWVDQMSLPRVFCTQLATIPAADGYLQAEPARVAAWRAMLPPGPKVGLAWAGNPAHTNDRRRSLPPGALRRILSVPGFSFVNLQVGPRSGELGLPDLSSRLTDFAETAALIGALDLVITVDTAVAHLAGAMGKPTWVMLPFAPDWRWLLGRDDSPWYASVRLFRQPTPNAWDAVTGAVAAALALFG